MIKHFCDRCGKEKAAKKKTNILVYALQEILGFDEDSDFVLCEKTSDNVNAKELCDDCKKSLEKWFYEVKE